MDSKEVKMILTAIEELAKEIKEIKQNTLELKDLLNELLQKKEFEIVPTINAQQYATDYDIDVPISSNEEFDTFEQKLRDDKHFQRYVVNHLRTLIDEEGTLVRNITNIMKFFFTKDLTLSFTAVRKSEDKKIFKDTIFCDCVESVVLRNRPNDNILANRKKFYKAIGSVFLNAKDWAGGRTARRRRPVHSEHYQYDEDNDERMHISDDMVYIKQEVMD